MGGLGERVDRVGGGGGRVGRVGGGVDKECWLIGCVERVG